MTLPTAPYVDGEALFESEKLGVGSGLPTGFESCGPFMFVAVTVPTLKTWKTPPGSVPTTTWKVRFTTAPGGRFPYVQVTTPLTRLQVPCGVVQLALT